MKVSDSKIDKVYVLEHNHKPLKEIEEMVNCIFLGLFTSRKTAKEAIKRLKIQPGFDKYPLKCFHIKCVKIDEYEWTDGFIL